MNPVLLPTATKLNQERKGRKRWHKVASVLSALVVFCTTYALILPAITMDTDAACGFEAHTHSEGCYTQQEITQPMCELAEVEAHIHGEGCYSQPQLVCQIPEDETHAHGDECYSQPQLLCPLPEGEGHIHGGECYSHTVELVLTCGKEEHLHVDACYPVEQEEETSPYLCAMGEHSHTEACFDGEGLAVCTLTEHSHEAACLVANLDLTAVETTADWEATLTGTTLTGHWGSDVVAVAASQLGYRESEVNCILTGDGLKGYTRYGDWYGNDYGDWCAMFASFCLHYAGVEQFPLESGCQRWLDTLKVQGFYADPEGYLPAPGDLIFFGNAGESSNHVGIVTGVIPGAEEDAPATIETIEGNCANAVSSMTYLQDDPAILGYGILPAGAVRTLCHEGEDYTVTVTFSPEAGIPGDATLSVREILPGTEEYLTYYTRSVAEMLEQGQIASEEELSLSFARFFDIHFLSGEEIIQPAATVDIQVSYPNGVEMTDGQGGTAVHFAEDGVELLEAETSGEGEDDTLVDTFQFAQNSFSVVGTVVSGYARAISASSAQQVSPGTLDGSGATAYVLYTNINGRYYAIDGNGYPAEVTVSGSSVTLNGSDTSNLLWNFSTASGTNTYIISNMGTGRHLHAYNNGGTNTGATTSGAYSSTLTINGNTVRIRGANNNYVRLASTTGIATVTTAVNSATSFYIAEVGQFCNIWFDGTNGGMMSYYGSDNTAISAIKSGSGLTVELPEVWKSPTKYPYKLQGWYDVYNHVYYPVNPDDDVVPTATLSGSTVFYADWMAASYDVGQNNSHVVPSLDTSDFITTYVFDYNNLFNLQSLTNTGSISGSSHSESWSLVNNSGTLVPYNNERSLGFAFIDYDAGGDITYPNNQDATNQNHSSSVTAGILDEVASISGGKNLLDLLFNPHTQVIGKNYVGTGNFLFQYMDSTTDNYDGEHDGYYYFDATMNAASYNQTAQRFYLYDYLERTSDSAKDGGEGEFSDFLPFNSPYIYDEGGDNGAVSTAGRVDIYNHNGQVGYEYDAKDGASSYQNYNTATDATTNYFFGIRTDIEFFLPNNTNTQDEYGNYGNVSTRGEHMVFDFHGDDDVWVFVDGELLLDIGGMHGVMHGVIDFSTGTVSVGREGVSMTTTSFEMSEGTHTMSVYYMERGSSQSNCAIYFNIAPRYDLVITKEDIVTAEMLDGAVFTVYNDEGKTSPAQLWETEEACHTDLADGTIDDSTASFTVVDGVAKCWGISAGKTYYIYETTPPPGYPASDDVIRITLNNRGTATIETTTLHGGNAVATEGFAVIKQEVNDTLKIVALTVTNQQDGDTTEVRVEKTWADGSENLPQSITVYLTADGVRIGRVGTLTEGNGWAYTWTGLPKYREEGVDEEIVYKVQEVLVNGYLTTQGDSIRVENYEDWIKVDQMSDSNTYLLVHNGQALSCNGSSFGWMDPETAKTGAGGAAQWRVTTDHDGFHLKNALGYAITFNPSSSTFYGTNSNAASLNQVIYFLNSRLVVHDHDVYYQFGANGSAVSSDGLAFTLYQQEIFTGLLTGIINVPVDEEEQTFVEVTKAWEDGYAPHEDEFVTVRLFANGEDTGRYLVLNAGNNWSGGFYELPYYNADGITPVIYTLDEDPVRGYTPVISPPTALPGATAIVWREPTAMTQNGIYRFVSGSYALAIDGDGNLTSLPTNLNDTRQQWQAVSYGNSLRLRNVATGAYLRVSGGKLTTTTSQYQSTAASISNGLVIFGQTYLEVGHGYAGATTNSANAANLRILQQLEVSGKPGMSFHITNEFTRYTLPSTGGMGTQPLAFGGLLILAAALMYTCNIGRKAGKGAGKHS